MLDFVGLNCVGWWKMCVTESCCCLDNMQIMQIHKYYMSEEMDSSRISGGGKWVYKIFNHSNNKRSLKLPC